ncbi:MAG: polyamine aminopropyltransferase [Chloroflexota bacterium]
MASNHEPVEITTTRRERATLLVAVLIISVCALTYELVVATLSSYLLGDSVTQFSFTIGFFLFAMGLGSLLSRRIKRHTLRYFIMVELAIALFGGLSALILYATFSRLDLYYYPVMISVSLAIGICVGLEIPLLTRIVADRAELSEALSDVLSIDYLGALIGSLAFPIILLPLLGVTQTAFLMGLCNIIVAVMVLWVFRHKLVPKWSTRLWFAGGGITIIMLAGSLASTDITRVLEQSLYSANVIYSQQTPYQRIVMTVRGEDYRLFINGNLQFSTLDEYRYHETLVHPVMMASRSRERVLVLGGGDGFAVREVLEYEDVQEVVVVDLDPAITELGRGHLILARLNENALDSPLVTIRNEDAFSYIQDGTDLFNVIIIDLPDPNSESLSKLYSDSFYRMLENRLTPDGAFVTQSTSPYFARRSFWTIHNTIEAAGFDTLPLHVYVPTFGEWGFIIGTPRTMPDITLSPDIDYRYLTDEGLDASRFFDPDIADDPVAFDAVNTLDNPILPQFYEADWRRWS